MTWLVAALFVAAVWWLLRRKRRRADAPELATLRQLIGQANVASVDMVRFRWRARTLKGDERAAASELLEVAERERKKAEGQVERLRSSLSARGFDVSGLTFPTLDAAEDAALLEDAEQEVTKLTE